MEDRCETVGQWASAIVSEIIESELHRRYNLSTEEINGIVLDFTYEYDTTTAIIKVHNPTYLPTGLSIVIPITYY
jgi:phosphorylcholine metabolism protein LicD